MKVQSMLASPCLVAAFFLLWMTQHTEQISTKTWSHLGLSGIASMLLFSGWSRPAIDTIQKMWNLSNASPLEKLAVLLIAFLTAFLTVVAVWEIPPSEEPLVRKTKTAPFYSPSAPDASPFTSRFGKTVIAGLGGLLMAEITRTLGGQPSAEGSKGLQIDGKWFYVIWFTVFFFVLLLSLGFVRAVTEGIRVRVALRYYPLSGYMRDKRMGDKGNRVTGWDRFYDFFSYWRLRVVQWLASWRLPVVTFFDTFIHLIQGKNQTTTEALSSTLIEQHQDRVRTVEALRKQLNDLLEWKLVALQTDDTAGGATVLEHEEVQIRHRNVGPGVGVDTVTTRRDVEFVPSGHSPMAGERKVQPRQSRVAERQHAVRVNISVLSADESFVFYISRAVGSSQERFCKRSMAWVSVFTGQIRWYYDYPHMDDKSRPDRILLFDNREHQIPEECSELWLDDYYQSRGEDYKAFVVFPVPWARHVSGTNYVKGAIHISFRNKEDFERIWTARAIEPVMNLAQQRREYPLEASNMVDEWCKDSEISAALSISLGVLGELLRGFDEDIFNNYIEPQAPRKGEKAPAL